MNQDQIDAFMRQFPSPNQILEMEPEELGPHVLRHMLTPGGETNRFNFMTCVPRGPITNCFMEAWAWLGTF
jgi:hypothetical protein